MKKKILISIIVFLIVICIITLLFSNSLLKEAIELTQVHYGTVSGQYSCIATVKANEHYQFFNGVVKNLFYIEDQRVNKDDLILEYYDNYEKVQKLNSNYNGYLSEVSSNYIKIIDEDDLYLQVEIKQDIVQRLNEESICVYLINDNYYTATIKEISNNGYLKNGQVVYTVKFDIDYDDIFLLQENVIVKISLEEKSGLIVDNRAVLLDEEGNYLLQEGYKDDLSNIDSYKVRIKVICADQSNSLIEAVGLENMSVCILSDSLRKVISDVKDN